MKWNFENKVNLIFGQAEFLRICDDLNVFRDSNGSCLMLKVWWFRLRWDRLDIWFKRGLMVVLQSESWKDWDFGLGTYMDSSHMSFKMDVLQGFEAFGLGIVGCHERWMCRQSLIIFKVVKGFVGFWWELMVEASLIWCIGEGQVVRNGQKFMVLGHEDFGWDYESFWAVMWFYKASTWNIGNWGTWSTKKRSRGWF